MRKLKRDVWPHQVLVKHSNAEAEQWCKQTIGYRFKDWYSYDLMDTEHRVFAFKDTETLVVFKLKWGNLT